MTITALEEACAELGERVGRARDPARHNELLERLNHAALLIRAKEGIERAHAKAEAVGAGSSATSSPRHRGGGGWISCRLRFPLLMDPRAITPDSLSCR